MKILQRLSTLDEDTIGGPNTCAHHNGRGCGQTQGTRAGNGQHRDGTTECKLQDDLYPSESFLFLKVTIIKDSEGLYLIFPRWRKITIREMVYHMSENR